MKKYLYVCGLSSDNGMFWISPVMADNREDAKVEYIDIIKNDKRLDFDESRWDGEIYRNKDDYCFYVGFLSITKDFVEVLESLEEYELDIGVAETLAKDIQDKFYEVGFDVDFDETTGKIVGIKMKQQTGRKLY